MTSGSLVGTWTGAATSAAIGAMTYSTVGSSGSTGARSAVSAAIAAYVVAGSAVDASMTIVSAAMSRHAVLRGSTNTHSQPM